MPAAGQQSALLRLREIFGVGIDVSATTSARSLKGGAHCGCPAFPAPPPLLGPAARLHLQNHPFSPSLLLYRQSLFPPCSWQLTLIFFSLSGRDMNFGQRGCLLDSFIGRFDRPRDAESSLIRSLAIGNASPSNN